MKRALLLSIPFIVVAVLVVRAVGINFWAVWNCIPVVAAWIILLIGLRSPGPGAMAVTVYAAISVGLTALFALAWLFDWGGTATKSSTGGLAFIVMPVAVVAIGGTVAYVVWGVASGLER